MLPGTGHTASPLSICVQRLCDYKDTSVVHADLGEGQRCCSRVWTLAMLEEEEKCTWIETILSIATRPTMEEKLIVLPVLPVLSREKNYSQLLLQPLFTGRGKISDRAQVLWAQIWRLPCLLSPGCWDPCHKGPRRSNSSHKNCDWREEVGFSSWSYGAVWLGRTFVSLLLASSSFWPAGTMAVSSAQNHSTEAAHPHSLNTGCREGK